MQVKTREGRPIKLEGNPEHPVNAGTLCSRGQAGLQALYNPDRLAGPMVKSAAGSWSEVKWDDAIPGTRFDDRPQAVAKDFVIIDDQDAHDTPYLHRRSRLALL